MLRASTPLFYTGQTSPVWPYTVQEEVNPPPPPLRKCTVLNVNFVFDLRDVLQEVTPGVKRDLPMLNLDYRARTAA